MRHWIVAGMLAILMSTTIPTAALTPGTDEVVPAGARGPGVVGFWVTDVYGYNLGSLTAPVLAARDPAL